MYTIIFLILNKHERTLEVSSVALVGWWLWNVFRPTQNILILHWVHKLVFLPLFYDLVLYDVHMSVFDIYTFI